MTLDQDFRRIAHEAALVGMTDEEAFRSRALWNDFAALFNTPEMAITPRSKWVRKMDAYIAHVEKYALSLGRQRKVLAQVVDALLPLTHGGEARMGAPGSGEFSHAEQLRKLELARIVSRLTDLKAEFSQMEKGLEGEQRKCERIQSELFSFSRAAASTALTSQSDFITAAKTLLSRVLSDVGVPAPKKSGIRFWSDSR
ncbi:MAG: hypothetical protein H7301_12675 [Cryobacterium sp.]|nr:hypothetical protein [Oligoflexia bacterium]